MKAEIQQLRSRLDKQKGKKEQLETNIQTLSDKIKESGRNLRKHEQALEIVKQVGLETQKQLQFHISDITSLALEAVFNDPYKLEVDFVERRNKTECDLYFSRNGSKIEPLEASGGGAVDIAAFALRIACWSMKNPHSRNVIILDEPMRFVSADLQEKASQMIKEISKRMGIQFIIVTHNDTLASYADKTFKVSIQNGISNVKTI